MRYDGAVHPGTLPAHPSLVGLNAANCQVFAYLLVRRHGRRIPWVRSSELWTDSAHTDPVARAGLLALDLVLLHRRPEAWGAHVAVALNATTVVHLARDPGHVEVRSLVELLADPRYRYLVGIKRPRSATTAHDEKGQ